MLIASGLGELSADEKTVSLALSADDSAIVQKAMRKMGWNVTLPYSCLLPI